MLENIIEKELLFSVVRIDVLKHSVSRLREYQLPGRETVDRVLVFGEQVCYGACVAP